ncbi:TusA-related sulfurtransferase [Pasteurella langaaensis DSM 22999]|uniref:TusA-related sulfurtransferase n=1 Tax=Alitibacter langaaensis DSM 22999 TaxID=1122935 RepID=A0A2U0SNQ9_9PAST|nr:sulfurtransferase TusA family protein [Pasteurella langaaensis]PVX32984.1 TusA-related sulfurtransferase [Pasteurella langaaensis DSM 22999]
MSQILDLRHYHCPIPLLMAKQALEKLEKGQYLTIWFGGTSAVKDFEILCAELKLHIISQEMLTAVDETLEYKMKISN